MRKIADWALKWLATSLYILILMILAIYMFWEGYAKNYVETYLNENYGQYIISTSNDLKILKNSKDDTGESTRTRD
jgi:hypothetical protein